MTSSIAVEKVELELIRLYTMELVDEHLAARAFAESREWASRITAESETRWRARETRDYEAKWAPHSEPATPDEWATYAGMAR